MAKKIRVTVTGEAEKLVEEFIRLGLSEEEIIAKGLTLLAMAQHSQLAQVDEKGEILGTLTVKE